MRRPWICYLQEHLALCLAAAKIVGVLNIRGSCQDCGCPQYSFVERMQTLLDADKNLDEVPSSQRRPLAKPLTYYEKTSRSRNEAIIASWLSGGYKMKGIAEYFCVHYSSVSKIIKANEDSRFKTPMICRWLVYSRILINGT